MITQQFENQQIIKAYLTIIHNNPNETNNIIEQPINKHPTFHEAYTIHHNSNNKQSITLYRVLHHYQNYTLLELKLKTNKTHQIQIHLSYLN